MLRNMVIVILLAVGALSFLSQETSQLRAQTGVQRHASERAARDAVSAAWSADRYCAKWLTMVQVNQIELARSALARVSDPDVKRFAQKVSDDQRQLLGKLRPFLSAAERLEVRASDKSSPSNEKSNRPGQLRAREPVEVTESLDLGALFDELGHLGLLTARAELESRQGAEFDRDYVARVVRLHLQLRDLAVVFRRHASAEFAAVLDETQSATEAQLSVARGFAERLERNALLARGSSGHRKEPR
jgi:predicted outer membrane protein